MVSYNNPLDKAYRYVQCKKDSTLLLASKSLLSQKMNKEGSYVFVKYIQPPRVSLETYPFAIRITLRCPDN